VCDQKPTKDSERQQYVIKKRQFFDYFFQKLAIGKFLLFFHTQKYIIGLLKISKDCKTD